MRILWMLYILTGLGAFSISFLLEGRMFVNLTGRPLFAYGVTAVLESAKIMTIMMHRFMSARKNEMIPGVVKSLTLIFKSTLIFLSLICSAAILSGYTDSHDQAAGRPQGRTQSNWQNDQNRADMQRDHSQRRQTALVQIKRRFQQKRRQLTAFYKPRIAKEETLRDAVVKNKSENSSKSPQWCEHNRKLRALLDAYLKKQQALFQEEREAVRFTQKKLAATFDAELKRLQIVSQTQSNGVSQNTLTGNALGLNKMAAALSAAIKNRFGVEIQIDFLNFHVFFAMLVSFLLESAIYIVFSYVIISHQTVFALQHDLHIGKQAIKASAKDDFFKERLHHNTLKSKVKNRVQTAKAKVSDFAMDALNL